VFSDCSLLLTEVLCATLEGGISARAVEVAEPAGGKFEAAEFTGAVAGAGVFVRIGWRCDLGGIATNWGRCRVLCGRVGCRTPGRLETTSANAAEGTTG
jgi:hypothetical protein